MKLIEQFIITPLLEDLFDDNSIGVIGEKNDNGADSYYCPCCLASETTSGNASRSAAINHIEHEPDCKLIKLYTLVKQMRRG